MNVDKFASLFYEHLNTFFSCQNYVFDAKFAISVWMSENVFVYIFFLYFNSLVYFQTSNMKCAG